MSEIRPIFILYAVRKKPFDLFVPFAPVSGGDERGCDIPGCAAPGQYRAPRSRNDLTSYFWFCLDHVRAYNASWNYYAGMDETEIEQQIRSDVTWWRPTWPLGARSPFYNRVSTEGVHLDFGAFAAESWTETIRQSNGGDGALRPRPGSMQERALAVLDLDPPVSPQAIKSRYKDLVKRHHPDANGGDKASEEKFKQINQAYETIMGGLAP